MAWLSTSAAYAMDAADWKKSLRDLGFFLAAALLTAFGTWWTTFSQENSGTAWVAVITPVITAGIAALITGINRWRRDNSQPSPDPVPPTPPNGLTEQNRTQWDK